MLDAPAPSPTDRPARALARLLHVGLAALAGFAAVDVIYGRIDAASDLRADSPLEWDAELAWKNRPGFRSESTAINAAGLRGPELPAERATGELRVLGVGPSLVYGAGVPAEETWAAALERLLAERDDGPWRVLNGGVNGYSTVQASRLAVRLLEAVDPDLVLLFVEPGEVSLLDPSATQRTRPWRDRLAPADLLEAWPEPLLPARLFLHDVLVAHSALYVRHRARGEELEGRPTGAERFVISDRPLQDPWMVEALERTYDEIERLARACALRGVELRAVQVLHRAQYAGNRWTAYLLSQKGGVPPQGTDREEPQRFLAAELERRGVRSWSLYPEISTFGNHGRWTLDDGSHWSDDGHARVAAGLARCLDEDPELAAALDARRDARAAAASGLEGR